MIARAWFHDVNRVPRSPRPMHKKGKKRAKRLSGVLSAKNALHKPLIFKEKLVGASGFEPPTSWSRTRRSSQAEPRPEGWNYLTMISRTQVNPQP